jgi:hypothetical protein
MWPTEKIVNLVGSVASIIGFAVLIVGWFSSSGTRDAEAILWQYGDDTRLPATDMNARTSITPAGPATP